MWSTSSSYRLSKQLNRAGGMLSDAGGVDRYERFAGGRWPGESDRLAIAGAGDGERQQGENGSFGPNGAGRPPRGELGPLGDRTGHSVRWHRPEVLSHSRAHYTPLSRITRAPCTSRATPKEARNMSLPVVKTASSVSGTPPWAPRSSPIRPTATRFSPSRCKSPQSRFRSTYVPFAVFHATTSLARMTIPSLSPLAETDPSSFGM